MTITTRQNKRLLILNAAADAIHRADSAEAVFQTFAEQIAELGCYGGLMLFDDLEHGEITLKGLALPPELQPFADNFSGDIVIPLSPIALFGKSALSAPPTFVEDNTKYGLKTLHALKFPAPERAMELAGKSIIRAPLFRRNKPIGILLVLGEDILPEDVPLVATLANHVSTAIEKIELVATAQRQALELATVYDAVLALASILDTQKVLHRLYELVSEVIVHDSFGVFLTNPSGDEFSIAMAVENEEVLTDILGTTFAVDAESGFTGYITRTRETLFIRDVLNETLPVKSVLIKGIDTRSWIGVPLIARERIVGVLTVQGWKPNMFTRQDLRLLETLAAGVAIALENARLYEQAQQEITERKQTETALARSEAFNRRLMDEAPIGILYLNTDGTIAYGNRALRGILGMPSDEYLNLQHTRLDESLLVQTDDIKKLMHKVLAGENLNGENVHIYSPWRKNVVVEVYGAPLFGPDKNPEGAVLMLHDLTQHHRTERSQRASYQISEAVYQARTLPELFAIIHQIISELIGVNNFYIAQYDEANDLFLFPYMADEKDEVIPHALGKSITGYVLRSGKTLLATTEELQAMEEAGMVKVLGTMPVDWLGIPLKVGEKYMGVLTVQSYDPAVRLDERHVQMLEFVSTQVAMAIERKQAEENIRQRNRELAILNKLINATTVAMDEQTVLQIACRELLDAFDMARTTATIVGQDSQTARVVAYSHRPGVPSPSSVGPIDLQNPRIRPLLALRAPMVINDVKNDKRIEGIRSLIYPDAKSLVLLPLVVDDILVGVLEMISLESHRFATPDMNFAWSFADQVSTGIARVRLQKSQRMLGAAISQAEEGVMITDSHGRVLYVNPALEQILGASHHKMIGENSFDILRRYVPAKQLRAILQSFKNMQPWSGRVGAHKPDGTAFTVDLTTAPVRDAYDNVVNYVGVVHDITAQLQLEEQYRQAQKMDAIGQLTGGIAHDFNNILTAVNGFAELLQRRLNDDDPRRRLANKILDSGQRAAALTSKLLTFSRKQIVEVQRLNLNDVVGHIEQMLRPIIGEHIHIVTTLSPDLWPIEADPTQIEQIIINLAVNARDAMPHGGKLIIETANEVLGTAFTTEHFGVKEGNYIRLSISDTGTGMPRDVQEHIFEPFYSTKPEGKGTGLGLATVFGIVKQSNGSIWVYSEVGKGTTFKIYLPASLGPRIFSSDGENTAGELPRGSETILVVEDDDDVRELATQILQIQGYTIHTAANGEAALAFVAQRQQPFDLVLTDVIMPGINGKTLADKLSVTHPALKIMFMSGYTNDLVATQGILSGNIALISKPFTAETLTRQVRQMLDS